MATILKSIIYEVRSLKSIFFKTNFEMIKKQIDKDKRISDIYVKLFYIDYRVFRGSYFHYFFFQFSQNYPKCNHIKYVSWKTYQISRDNLHINQFRKCINPARSQAWDTRQIRS